MGRRRLIFREDNLHASKLNSATSAKPGNNVLNHSEMSKAEGDTKMSNAKVALKNVNPF